MVDLDLFDISPVRAFPFNSAIRLAINRDDCFLYVDSTHCLHFFDSSSLSRKALPSPDRSIRGVAITADISPSHQFAVVAYSDGAVQLFNLDENKAVRLLSKPHAGRISSVSFKDDSSLFISESHVVSLIRITGRTWLASPETEVLRTASPVRCVLVPPVHRYVSGARGSSRLIGPRFSDAIAILTDTAFFFGFFGHEFTPSLDLPDPATACAFDLSSPDVLTLSVASSASLRSFSIDGARRVSALGASPLSFPAAHVCFASGSVVVALAGDLRGSGHTLSGASAGRASGDGGAPSCVFVFGGVRGFHFASDRAVLRAAPQTFRSRMERLRGSMDSGGFAAAYDLCRSAVSGDAVAAMGLPANEGQRALVVEGALSDFLAAEAERRLSGGDAPSVAAWVIGVCRELGMEDWVVGTGVAVFRAAGALPALLAAVVAADADAALFAYTAEFAGLLLAGAPPDAGAGARAFLLRLPAKVVPVRALLESARAAGDARLVSDVFARRLGDVVGALAVLADGGLAPEACALVAAQPSEAAVRWLFARGADGRPQLARLLPAGDACVAAVAAAQAFVERTGRPLPFGDFVGELLAALGAGHAQNEHALCAHADALVLREDVRIAGRGLRALMRRILAPGGAAPAKEAVLERVVAQDLAPDARDALLPLCDALGFRAAKRQIHAATSAVDAVVRELAPDRRADVFAFMAQAAARGPETAARIAAAAAANAAVLIARRRSVRSVRRRARPRRGRGDRGGSARGRLQERAAPRVAPARARRVVRCGLRRVLRVPRGVLPGRGAGVRRRGPARIDRFVAPCERFGLFECLAVVLERLGDAGRACDAFARFIEIELVAVAEGREGDVAHAAFLQTGLRLPSRPTS
jgi:hypothetical protein